jgi:hypothetical protein
VPRGIAYTVARFHLSTSVCPNNGVHRKPREPVAPSATLRSLRVRTTGKIVKLGVAASRKSGCRLTVVDDHAGLKAARQGGGRYLRDFNAPGANEAKRRLELLVKRYTKSAPKLAPWAETGCRGPVGLCTSGSAPAATAHDERAQAHEQRTQTTNVRRNAVPERAACPAPGERNRDGDLRGVADRTCIPTITKGHLWLWRLSALSYRENHLG